MHSPCVLTSNIGHYKGDTVFSGVAWRATPTEKSHVIGHVVEMLSLWTVEGKGFAVMPSDPCSMSTCTTSFARDSPAICTLTPAMSSAAGRL